MASPFNVRMAVTEPFVMPPSTESIPGAVKLAPWHNASTAESRTTIFGSKAIAFSMGWMNFLRMASSFCSCQSLNQLATLSSVTNVALSSVNGPARVRAKFLHVGANAEDFADVVAEFADVGSAFAAHFEENVSSVCFHVIYVVNTSSSKLPFN